MSEKLATAVAALRAQMEPVVQNPAFHYSEVAAMSQAVSLKRIADALEKLESMPGQMSDSLYSAITTTMANR